MSWLDAFFAASKAQAGLFTDSTATGAVVLTAAQAQTQIWKFAQSLTGNLTYYVPVGTLGTYTVDTSGATLGGHTLSVAVLGGTPVSLSAAQHVVYSDGTNMHTVV